MKMIFISRYFNRTKQNGVKTTDCFDVFSKSFNAFLEKKGKSSYVFRLSTIINLQPEERAFEDFQDSKGTFLALA